ncbi:MAG TPA: hypothetical protein VGV89_04510 [Thermoplasmata archaeon]|nr:hypothetical protein [Thermoplasmata archaeon]
MERSWIGKCDRRECRHASADHLSTPELASQPDELVLFCQSCRRHEVIAPPRWPWARGRRVALASSN